MLVLDNQLLAGNTASALQLCVPTPRSRCRLALAVRWPQDPSIKSPDTWDELRLTERVACVLPSTSDMLLGTCPYTAALHPAESR